MQQDGDQPLSVIVRRFVRPPECVELAIENAGVAMRPPTSCRIWCGEGEDGSETRAYLVELAENVFIRPVDWRRFAYDHEKVASLVVACANDNFGLVCFDLMDSPGEYIGRFEKSFSRALQDLGSIFDAKSVECELREDCLLTTVAGEYKNGKTAAISIQHPLPT